VHCNTLCESRDEALRVPRGDIRLAACGGCGFVRNVAFDPERIRYDATYENSLQFSARFRSYVQDLAEGLINRHGLRGKDLLEIACGRGDFLRLLCELGDCRGVGFDPSHVPEANHSEAQERIEFIQDFYSERHGNRRADLICCRHALEHIPDPVAFLRIVRSNIGDRAKTVVFFEVPNVLFTLRDLGIWDIIYEHCSYFGPGALARSFVESGFVIDTMVEAYGGQFLCIEAFPATGRSPDPGARYDDGSEVTRETKVFTARFEEKLHMWRSRLARMAEAGRRVVVWGSGSKGATFLNMMKDSSRVEYAVDINMRKQGMYVAGTGQEIVGPSFLQDYRPDHVIVMNPIYVAEIGAAVREMGLTSELQVA
jgi:SAM-dependent methyltransferase